MLLLVNLWLTCINTLWRVNASVQLHIHAQYVCVHWPWRWQRMYNFSLFGASAADHLCSTVTVLSCWMFRLSWEGSTHDRHRWLSSWLFCVVSHTHTHTHTHTPPPDMLRHWHTEKCICTSAEDSPEGLSQFPGEAAGFGFTACIDRGSGWVEGSIRRLKGGVSSSD